MRRTCQRAQRRHSFATGRIGSRAAGRKGATRRQRVRWRHGAGNGHQFLARTFKGRQCRQQAFSIGMRGSRKDPVHRRVLDHAAAIHDHHALGQFGDHTEIVGNQHQRHVLLGADLGDQRENLGLNGGIERRGRLVRHQHIRLAGQSHGDHDPLVHAAGQFMWIVAQTPPRIGNSNPVQKPQCFSLGRRARQAAMPRQRFVQLPADAVQRVERTGRVLKDHRDLATTDLGQFRLRQVNKLLPAERHRAADAGALAQEAQGRQPGDGLAAAGFAHNSQSLARGERQIDPVKRADVGLPVVEIDGQALDVDQRIQTVTR